MIRYVIRRLLWACVLFVAVTFVTYVIFYVIPADPAKLFAGKAARPEDVARVAHNLRLDKPFYEQYFLYMKKLLLHFDFGYSYQNNVEVRHEIFSRLPATMSLAAGGAVIWLLIGIPIGILSDRKSVV